MSKTHSLTDTEFYKILSSLKKTQNNSRNRLMFLFGYYCGMRVSEISNLTYSHILNNDGSIKNEIHFKPNQNKSKRNIVYYVSDKLKIEIESYINKKRDNLDFFENKSGVSSPKTKRIIHSYSNFLFNRSQGCVI